jgi:exonuclease VII large subunit
MSKIDIDELLKILPKLIRENDTVKGAIISALSGVVATHEDIVELNKKMDKRFEAIQKSTDKRFEAMDKRFKAMDKRFETMQQSLDKRFERMDKRFEAMQKNMDQRFEKVDTDFSEVKDILKHIQTNLGKSFEQFGRNIVIKLLKTEGYETVTIKPKRFKDPEDPEGSTEIFKIPNA